jgi:hypothetical protein
LKHSCIQALKYIKAIARLRRIQMMNKKASVQFIALLVTLTCAGFTARADAQFVQQGPKVVGTGAVGGAHQGDSVAASANGTTILIGGHLDDTSSGAVWVFTRSNGAWIQQGAKLVGTGAVGAASQGISVSLSGDAKTALIGGPGDGAVHTGATWVFTQSDSTWTQQGTKLVGSGAVGDFPQQGYSVALSADGSTAIVGAVYGSDRNSISTGAAWVFTRSGGIWTQQGSKLVANSYLQGPVVALSGDGNTALVQTSDNGEGLGGATVFTRSAGVWTIQQDLRGVGAVGAANQGQSLALSFDGNTAIIGGPHDDSDTGAVWVFTRSNRVWTQEGTKLVGADSNKSGGHVYQGCSVGVSSDGNTIVFGGEGDSDFAGAAWIFTRSNGVWTQRGTKLVGTGAAGNAIQGKSVALSADGRTAVVGGNGDAVIDDAATGAAWVFAKPIIGFSSFLVKLKLASGISRNTDQFDINSNFTLGPDTKGIDPAKQIVTIKIGASSTTLPVGSFKFHENQDFYTYSGLIGIMRLDAIFKRTADKIYTFQAKAHGADLSGTTNPVSVTLAVGDDSGTATVMAGRIY